MKDFNEQVAGFLFDDYDVIRKYAAHVLLVLKANPAWQKDKLNGIGGKIEENETPKAAMVREFKEETGLDTFENDWSKFCYIHGKSWGVHFFRAFNLPHFWDHRSMERQKSGEIIAACPLKTLDYTRTISNLKWLIPLALDYELKPVIDVEYHE